MIVSALWWLSFGLTSASIAYLLLAIAAVAMHRQRPGPGWVVPPQVTVLKPLCGREIGLEAALESFIAQKTDFPVRFVFGASDGADPALKTCQNLAARYPGCSVEFLIDPSERGRNPKVSNLINMTRAGLDEVVVISDSDILIAPGTLQAAIDALAAEGVGAVTTLYRARPSIANDRVRSFGAWYLDYWDLPMQMLYARLVPLATAYGPLTAVRRGALEAIGGLQALADHLCDDAELGRLVRKAGYTVAFTPALAETLVNDGTVSQLFQHELRWARSTLGNTAGGFAASVVNCPGAIPLLLLLHPSVAAVLVVAAPVLLRSVLATIIVRRFGRAPDMMRPGLVDLWLRDCACFAVWAAAFLVKHVHWRGQRLSLSQGLIQPEPVPMEQNV